MSIELSNINGNYCDLYENIPENYHSGFSLSESCDNQNIIDSIISKITKKNKLLKGYHFLCIFCQKKIPEIIFVKNDQKKIKLSCVCQKYPIDISIIQIKDYLINCDEELLGKLKCSEHSILNYEYYCYKCKKDLCRICCKDCKNKHDNEVENLSDDRITGAFQYIDDIIDKINKEKKNSINDNRSSSFFNDSIIINVDYNKNHQIENNFKTIITNLDNNKENLISNDNEENSKYIVSYNMNNNRNNVIIDNNNNFPSSLLNISTESIFEDFFQSFLDLIYVIIRDYQKIKSNNHNNIFYNIENYLFINYDKHNNYNEIILKYEINQNIVNDDEKVALFGELFVTNNAKKCFLIINEKIMNLKTEYKFSDILEDNNKAKKFPISFEVRLVEKPNDKITDLSYMFYGISILSPSSDFSNFKSCNINKMVRMFYNCKTLKSLPDISNLDTSNVTDMSEIFYNCNILEYLPNISKCETNNIVNMSGLFKYCSTLKSIPDISKWKTNKVIHMNDLFFNCSNIRKIPDISKWNTDKLKEMNNMFSGCISLSFFPKISNWKIENVVEADKMFFNCKELEYEPEISKWKEIMEKKGIFSTFEGCDNLIFENNDRIPSLICSYCNRCFKFLCGLKKYFLMSLIFFPPFFLFYYSVNLEKTNNSIINQFTYNFPEKINYTNSNAFANLTDFTNIEDTNFFYSKQNELKYMKIILAVISLAIFLINFPIVKRLLYLKQCCSNYICYYICFFLLDCWAFYIDFEYFNFLSELESIFEKIEKSLNKKFNTETSIAISNFDFEKLGIIFDIISHVCLLIYLIYLMVTEYNS